MMAIHNKLTVSIGIPAYNEERNIKQLLTSLLSQKHDNYVLQEIIVVSDGSTDGTVALVREIDDQRIRVVDGQKRRGQQVRQNQLLKIYQGDVLVLIEADTLPVNDQTLGELIKPFIDGASDDLGMTVSGRLAVPPQSWLETILWHGGELKEGIFRDWKSGNNLYMCGGHAFRALPRRLTRQLLWPDNVPEDAYLYLFIKQLQLRVQWQEISQAYMKHVTTVSDRLRQCTKYVRGKRELGNYFSEDVVQVEYALPILLRARHIWHAMLEKPNLTVLALLEMFLNRTLVWKHRRFSSLYDPHRSSKDFSRVIVLATYGQ